MKLILEDGGERRAFRLGDGVVTVGSGAEARIRVQAADVAEIHFELEVSGDSAVLRPRPGVLPPTLDGAPVSAAKEFGSGHVLHCGSVRFWIQEAEGAPAPPAPAAAPAARPRPAPTVHRRRSVVQRTQPRVRKGLPGWAISAIVVGVAGVGVLAFKAAFESQAEEGASTVQALIDAAEAQVETGNFDIARDKLAAIPEARGITAAERTRITALEEKIAARERSAELVSAHQVGNRFLEVMLRKYEARYLTGEPEPSKVRLFLMRCQEFRERWPEHPEMDWVDRQQGRFAGTIDLSAPPTWEDVEWEVADLTRTAPRNYVAAFALLDEIIVRGDPRELRLARKLLLQLEEERVEYHEDKLEQARYEWETKDSPSKSVWWLLHAIIWIGDEDMANEAADFLLKVPRLTEHLRGYEVKYPEKYEAVLQHPRVAAYARENGLLD